MAMTTAETTAIKTNLDTFIGGQSQVECYVLWLRVSSFGVANALGEGVLEERRTDAPRAAY